MDGYIDAGGLFLPSFKASGYDGATRSPNRQMKARSFSRSQDEDRLVGSMDRETLRLECLHLRRNNSVVAGVSERFSDNVAGPDGIIPQAKTSSNDWNERAEAFWMEYSKVSDVRGMFSLRETQRLTVQSRLHSGEVGFILLDNGQLQAVEADRIATPSIHDKDPNVIEGVKLSDAGRPLAYFVCERDRNGYVDRKKFVEVKAADFIHVVSPFRFDQTRGVPELASIINTLSDHHDLTEAILLNARINARRSAVVTTAQGGATIGQLGARNSTAQRSDKAQVHEHFGKEMLTYYLNSGEDVKLLSSDTPGANYIEHNIFLLKLIGAALSIPYDFLLLDFSQGSAGNNRVALMQTYRKFEQWQSWLKDKFLQRLWNWRIAKAIKSGALPPAPIDERGFSEWYRVDWIPPEYSWADPNKEAAANLSDFKMGTLSLSSITRRRGKDGRDSLHEKGSDIADAMDVAEEINKKRGTNLTWRDLIDVAVPGANLAQDKEEAPDNSTKAGLDRWK